MLELGQTKMNYTYVYIYIYTYMKQFVFCVARCGTKSLSRRVPCPLLKVVLEAKKRPKNNMFLILYLVLFCFILS